MTTTPILAVLGDDIRVLRGFSPASTAGDEQTRSARGVVWGVNLTGLTPRAARARLKDAASAALHTAGRHVDAWHLTVVFTHDIPHQDETYWSAAEAIAARLCARLELAQGREWDVVVIDASRCDDAGLFHARLREAAASRAGSVGNAALEWHDVRDQAIHRAAARHTL